MRDNEIYAALLPIFNAGFAAALPAAMPVDVRQSYNPVNIAALTGPALYLSKVSDHRLGSPKRREYLDETNPAEPYFVQETTQFMESVFQATAVFRQDPAVIGLTASDVANEAAAIIQVDDAMAAMRLAGFSVLRVTDLRNPANDNDRGEFEFFPSFDFTLEHEQVTVRRVAVATATELKILRV